MMDLDPAAVEAAAKAAADAISPPKDYEEYDRTTKTFIWRHDERNREVVAAAYPIIAAAVARATADAIADRIKARKPGPTTTYSVRTSGFYDGVDTAEVIARSFGSRVLAETEGQQQ